MCFSAPASFVSGALLTGAGLATLSRNSVPEQRIFAAMPLVFGLQQISEGFVWYSLQTPGQGQMLAVSSGLFLFAALILWPTYVPLAAYKMEPAGQRKKWLRGFLYLGILTSFTYLAGMVTYPVQSQIEKHHILYTAQAPELALKLLYVFYLLTTILPLFVSSRPHVRWFAGLILVANLVSLVFYTNFLVSIWCFFSAIASFSIWWILRPEPKLAEVADHG
jgi:hypothetical protein